MAKKSRIRDVDHGWSDIKKEVKKMKNAAVTVGVHQNAGMAMERDENGVTKPGTATMAEVAYYNEFGTRRGIPERPFIRATADEKSKVYAKFLRTELMDVFAGKRSVKRALTLVGTLAQGHVRKKIKTLRSPANAASTIKAKGSSNPLVDTGHLIKKIDFEVRT